jgi:hypothetical protein
MSDDIIARLEQIETDIEYSDVAHVCGKAADEIERLRAELAARDALLKEARKHIYCYTMWSPLIALIDAALAKGGGSEKA